MTRPELAQAMSKAPSWIFRLEDPNEKPPTISTLLEVANAFDTNLNVNFGAFSEFLDRVSKLTPESFQVPSFDEELADLEKQVEQPEVKQAAAGITAQSLKGLMGLRPGEYFPESDLIRQAMEKAVERVQAYANPGMAGFGLLDLARLVIQPIGVGGESENVPENSTTPGVSKIEVGPKVVSIDSGQRPQRQPASARQIVRDPLKRRKDRGGLKRHAG
jgi:transcriptional regulator with XRE-family HTH domain